MTELKPSGSVSKTAREAALEDLRRRRAEAADVLAETLFDIWLSARRARGVVREDGLEGGGGE